MLEIYLSGVVLVWVIAFLCNRYLSTEIPIATTIILSFISYIGISIIMFVKIVDYLMSDNSINKSNFNDWFERGGR